MKLFLIQREKINVSSHFKNIFIMRYIVFFSLIGLFFSCKTEVDLIGDYKVTPVIYGLLDQSDSIHYIKINRTFLGQGNALDMAQVPDSSYFDNVFATITETLSNGATGRTWVLRDTLVENKETNGVFFAPEQKLYYFATPTIQNDPTNSLKPDAKYRLDVNINDGEFNITAETELINGVLQTTPNSNSSYIFIGSQPNDYRTQIFAFLRGNAKRFSFRLDFHYSETDVNNVVTDKSFQWTFPDLISSSGTSVLFNAAGEVFFQTVRNRIPVDNNIVKREPTFFTVNLVAGSEVLDNFINANQPSSSLAQNKPSYTNLEGGAIGVFTARYTIQNTRLFINPVSPNQRGLSEPSTKELCQGQYTSLLNFCSSHIQDTNPPANPNVPKPFACP